MNILCSLLSLQIALADDIPYIRGGELPSYNIQLVRSAPDNQHSFLLQESLLLKRDAFVRITRHNSSNLLTYENFFEEEEKLLSSANQFDMHMGYTLFSLLRFAVSVPYYQTLEGDSGGLATGTGDLSVDGKIQFSDMSSNQWGGAFIINAQFPTAQVSAPMANENGLFGAHLVVEHSLQKWLVARVNLGHQGQSSAEYENYTWDDTFVTGLGLSMPLGWTLPDNPVTKSYGLSVEMRSLMPYNAFGSPSKHVSEGFVGGWFEVDTKWVQLLFRGGSGIGMTTTPGTASSRTMFDMTYMIPL